jgi:hypothetical protein
MRTKKLLPFWLGILMLLATNQIKADSIERGGACATLGVTWNVFVRDSIAYIADRGIVTTVNIIDPYNPWVIDSINGGPPIGALGMCVFDTVAYCNLTGIGTRFITLNISKPDSLNLLGWCPCPGAMGNPTGIVLKDTIIYLATGQAGVMQINVADPSQPDTIKSFSSITVVDLALVDTLLYAVGGLEGLKILNIADPLNPILLGSVPIPQANRGIFVVDTFAYVTRYGDGYGALLVVNVSNPTAPQIVASADNLKGDPCDVWIQSHYAYVAVEDFWFPGSLSKKHTQISANNTFAERADEEGGLRIVDISNPLNPTLIASYDTPHDPRGLFAVDTLIFIADQESLQILRHVGSGIAEKGEKEHPVCRDFQVYPNPFFGSITIKYNLPKQENVTLDIFDVTGRRVRTIFHGQKGAGLHAMQWNATDQEGIEVSSGIYILRIRIGSEVLSRTVILAK